MNSREGFELFFQRVERLMKKLETEEYGQQFALYLHYEMRLPLTKIHRLVQAASKMYIQKHDMYCAKVLLYHPFRKDKVIKVPRLAPPRSAIYSAVQNVQANLGVQASDDGRLAFRSFEALLLDLVVSDAGKQGVPSLAQFLSGEVVHFCIQLDATGFGMQQINTIAMRNPRLSASAQQLRIFGLGNCSDDRAGSTSLLGPNLEYINRLLVDPRVEVEGGQVVVEPLFCMDLAALRHTEHLAASGWCGCSRDFALRHTPRDKPTNATELATFLEQCCCPSPTERFILSHSPLPGEEIPRPCIAPGCTFAHDCATAQKQLDDLLLEEQQLVANTSKAGKSAFSRWRMAHAQTHRNIQPGKYGRPMFRHHLDNQILDSLHLRDLGLPKIPWKYGILNNASDDAREEIAAQLKTWGHPLDTRRKDDNRCRNQKWFTGEAWNTFCNGQRGSPGGPVAIAEIVSIIAHDLLQRGVDHGCESAGALQVDDDVGATQLDIPQQGEGPDHGGCGRGRGRGGRQGRSKSAFSDRIAAKHSSAAAPNESDEESVGNRQEIEHQPTQVEKDADADAVQLIRETFKSRAQTILNALLAFDAYFAWYYPMKCGVSFMCPIAERQRLALHCCRTAIDMHEIFERISARNHGSFLPHGAIFKMPRDILKIGDIEAAGASPLELQNAETKRAASSVGARNISFLERSKGSVNATSMALSTLNHVLAAQYLRRRKGAIALDASRATERLFGVESAGRLTRKWIKPEVDGQYSPRLDTCVKAFARLLIAQQSSSASASTSK